MRQFILNIISIAVICNLQSYGNIICAFSAYDSSNKIYLPISQNDSIIKDAIYSDTSASASDRALDLIRRMSFEEKIAFTGGWNKFMIPGISRLGIRPVSMADASQGIRLQTAVIKEKSTSFPGMLPLASTWNVELVYNMAGSLAEECRSHGVDLLLGPGINMQRLSVGGRNFEYMGEDPCLTSAISYAYVKAMYDNGIISVPKHFVGNDQEFCRHIANSIIDERTLREIYLRPWENLIRHNICYGIMTGNNLVNGIHCAMNKPLLDDILKKEFGFRGIIMTDWQNSAYFPALQNLILTSGVTLLMPENTTFKNYLEQEIKISENRKNEIEFLIERMIFPTIYTLFEFGIYDRYFALQATPEAMEAHKKIAAECAVESMVLLKNDNILPIKKGKRILLTGKEELHSGTGSGYVEGYNHISYYNGLKSIYGDQLNYQENPDSATVKNADIIIFNLSKEAGEGKDIPFAEPEDQINELENIISMNNNVIVLVNACNTMPMEWAEKVKGVIWCYFLGQERGRALAKLISGEENFSGRLPFSIENDFSDSPSPDFNHIGGKPFWSGDNKSYKKYWLGLGNSSSPDFSEYVEPGQLIDIEYDENIYIGYRWYERNNIDVRYPFGYGLSYTCFNYEKINCTNNMNTEGTVTVTVQIKNSGSRQGKEVVQIYIKAPHSSVQRPEKELKAFKKIQLEPGESKEIEFNLDSRDFSYWSETEHKWTLEHGEFIISAGKSSKDLLLNESIIL